MYYLNWSKLQITRDSTENIQITAFWKIPGTLLWEEKDWRTCFSNFKPFLIDFLKEDTQNTPKQLISLYTRAEAIARKFSGALPSQQWPSRSWVSVASENSVKDLSTDCAEWWSLGHLGSKLEEEKSKLFLSRNTTSWKRFSPLTSF